jgi:5-formyltetrahydrofolate cyclo-ligase
MPQPIATKSEVREGLHALRNAMTPEERQRASDAITVDLLALERYQAARTVMAYMTFGSEFVTNRFIGHALAASKVLVLPRIDRARNRLALHAVRDLDAELTTGPWGIREPRPDVCPPVAVAQIDFILVPGLGFTPRGDRLGYGRGYYDRLLAQREPHTAVVAAAFAVQMLEDIPISASDAPVDMVVTEVETYRSIR